MLVSLEEENGVSSAKISSRPGTGSSLSGRTGGIGSRRGQGLSASRSGSGASSRPRTGDNRPESEGGTSTSRPGTGEIANGDAPSARPMWDAPSARPMGDAPSANGVAPSSRPMTGALWGSQSREKTNFNWWSVRREEMELAVMMGMHKMLGQESPLRMLASEAPGIHLTILYGADRVLSTEEADAAAKEKRRLDEEAAESRRFEEGATSAERTANSRLGTGASSSSTRGTWQRPATGAAASSIASHASGAGSRPGTSGSGGASAADDYVCVVDRRWLVRRGENVARRSSIAWCSRGGVDDKDAKWRMHIAQAVMLGRGWGGKVPSKEALTRRGMREMLLEMRSIEDKGRIFTDPQQAIDHSAVCGSWGVLDDGASDIRRIEELARREMAILRTCADGLAQGEAMGIPALGDLWQRGKERAGVKQRDMGELVQPSLGPPARLEPALLAYDLYSVYGDAGGLGDAEARRALIDSNVWDDTCLDEAGQIEHDVQEAREALRLGKERLARTQGQVKFLHTQFSYNARVLGRLGEAEVSLKHLGGQVMACEHKLDFLIGKSAVRRLPAVSAAVQDKVGLVALKERVEEGYAKLAALAAEAAGCVFELHTRHGMSVYRDTERPGWYRNSGFIHEATVLPDEAGRKMQRLQEIQDRAARKEVELRMAEERLRSKGFAPWLPPVDPRNSMPRRPRMNSTESTASHSTLGGQRAPPSMKDLRDSQQSGSRWNLLRGSSKQLPGTTSSSGGRRTTLPPPTGTAS